MAEEPKALEKSADKLGPRTVALLGSSRSASLMEELWPWLEGDNRMSHSPNQLVKALHTFQF